MKNLNKKIILASTLIALFASCGSSGGGSNHKSSVAPNTVKVSDKDTKEIQELVKNESNGFEIQEDDMSMDDETAYTINDKILEHKEWAEFKGDVTSAKKDQTTFKLENDKQFYYKGNLNINGDDSTGILVANGDKKTRLVNDGTILVNGKNSRGIYGNSTSEITSSGDIKVSGEKSTGIESNGGSLRADGGTIDVSGTNATGIKLENINNKEIELQQTINLTGDSETGIYVDNSNIKNAMGENINIDEKAKNSVAMYGTNGSTITNSYNGNGNGKGSYGNPNNAHINVNGSSNIGIKVEKDSIGFNDGTITLNGSSNIGMLAIGKDSKVTNRGTIELGKDSVDSVAMEARNGATVENDGDIILPGNSSDNKNINDWDPSTSATIKGATTLDEKVTANTDKFTDSKKNTAFRVEAGSRFINKGSITFKGNK